MSLNFSGNQRRILNGRQTASYNKLFGASEKLPQKQIQVKRIIINDRQICSECKGDPMILSLENGARLNKTQPLNEKYNHKKGCSQERLF